MNKRTTPQRVVERANIVLCSAEGRSGSAICREVGVSRPTVTQWLDRYEAGGVEELLEDRPRSGRPRKITPDDEAEIVRKTLEEKPADATHWSCRLMAKEVGVHPTTISRIWRAHGLQPHRIEYFKLSTDPHFVEKLRDVVGLYVDPPERAVVFAFDEKSQIQALDRSPDRPRSPLRSGGEPRVETCPSPWPGRRRSRLMKQALPTNRTCGRTAGPHQPAGPWRGLPQVGCSMSPSSSSVHCRRP